jgi:DNA-binding transcriptional ArsR family regulator
MPTAIESCTSTVIIILIKDCSRCTTGILLQYNNNIDNAIVNELNIMSSVSYLELKRRIEELLNRTISFDTYNVHLRKMLKENILNKQDDGKRGKHVFYSLTEEAKKQIQLNLLGVNPEQIIFRRIYEKLDRLLLEINATRNDLYERLVIMVNLNLQPDVKNYHLLIQ